MRDASGAPEAELASPIADINSLQTRTATAVQSIASHTQAATFTASPTNTRGQASIPRDRSCLLNRATRSHDSTTKMRLVTLAAAMGLAALPLALTAAVPTRDTDSTSSGQIMFAAADESASEQIPHPADANDFARVKLTLGVMSRCPDAVLVETLFDRVLERKTSSGLGDNAPETVAGLVDLRLDYIARFVGFQVRDQHLHSSRPCARKMGPH